MRLEIPVGERAIVLETGKLARQAGGAVTARFGDTTVLSTATRSQEPRPGATFLPLSVDIEERMSSAGKIPGGFLKREGKPSEKAILTARLTDRPIRPLFPKDYYYEIQVIGTVLVADQENPYDVISMVGASAALALSDIPFGGPIGAVRVGRHPDGGFILNPTYQQLEESDLDIVVAGTKEAITMVEAGAREVTEDVVVEALEVAQGVIREQAEAIERWAAEHGREKQPFEEPGENPFVEELRERYLERIKEGLISTDRRARHEAIDLLKEEAVEGRSEEEAPLVLDALAQLQKEAFRRLYLEDRKRTDLRRFDELRPTTAEAHVLPRVHGTGLFTRGETQVLSSLALADLGLVQRLDTLEPQTTKRYMHHYYFPPYSTGETGRLGPPRRREIGHGALAERALLPVIPSEEEFPYAIRIISEVLESNGSSSMASVCGSTLALMDGGVPIKAPVAGVAMGLVKEGEDYVILTDIQGLEDHMGDMDFKVAGTRDGITALQMDMKITGVSAGLLKEALEQARRGRLEILDIMQEEISEPRPEISDHAPRVEVLQIPTDKIGLLIGPGGKTINALQDEYGVNISVENDGTVYVAGVEGMSVKAAVSAIKGMTKEVEAGDIYVGKVVKTTNFGAFVELTPGRDGLLHISRLAPGKQRVRRVEDVLNEGDVVKVRVLEIDKQNRISLEMVED
ncbi:Polyribonucleotide nucleotidyltransferase [Rubrobacter xylanophilus DSM 9941]|uniref:polyribonucleotide nucleotidyltransferase n=1 Tax=Rubrobacter xylanophilus TaxID=49319 RepID=UPI001C63EF1D|nr:polyribonucleotide nucleotidyltransferase [Rubrobacter xylanophilus]QYJ14653.1 Polyribonucleotide nucleotidyltransferase [Rubrobacter xylanophilus DSM 9941]